MILQARVSVYFSRYAQFAFPVLPTASIRLPLDIYTPQAHSASMLTVIETPLFQKQWPLYWTEDERGAFAAYVAMNPTAGDEVPNLAGCERSVGAELAPASPAESE